MSSLPTNYLAPSGREEAWRFTPLTRLGGLLDASVTLTDHPSLAPVDLPAGVSFGLIPTAPLAQNSDEATLRVRSAVAQTSALTIAKDSEISQPIVLKRSVAGSGVEASRLLISLGAHARATVLIENTGSATIAEEIEISLDTGSSLHFISTQEWDAQTIHLGSHHAIVGKDAEFISTVITVGGSLVRLLPTVEYSGQGGSAELSGVYFSTSGQHLEHRMHVDHNVPNCKSRVNYKGALAGESARSVWIGDVFIRAAAEGTDTYELNRNLVLTDGARADSVPNLEIETGEIVGAGHASTTGRFDDEQLFYLQSRGIPEEIARRLVIRGFFAEIVSGVKIESVEERIMARIDAELDAVAK
jgi:Fe-S cluster assembly protein SufD